MGRRIVVQTSPRSLQTYLRTEGAGKVQVGLDVLKVSRDCVRGAGKVSGACKLILLCPQSSQWSISIWLV